MARKKRGGSRGRRKGGGARFTAAQLIELGVDPKQFQPAGKPGELPPSGAQDKLEGPAPKGTRDTFTGDKIRQNKTEARYEAYLATLKLAGAITDFMFEPLKLRIGPTWQTSYRPDFGVLTLDGVLEIHEVKGASSSKGSIAGAWWEDGARDKVKIAAGLFPFRFVAVHEKPAKQGGGWAREVFPPEEEASSGR